jgi:hypothetical protein
MEMTIAIILLCAKLVVDIALGHKALKEVRLLREAVTEGLDSHGLRLDNHETRLDKLENQDAA